MQISEVNNEVILSEGMKGFELAGTIKKGIVLDKDLESFLGQNNINFLRNNYVINAPEMSESGGITNLEPGEIIRICYFTQNGTTYAVPSFCEIEGCQERSEVLNFNKKKLIVETPVHYPAQEIDFRSLKNAKQELGKILNGEAKSINKNSLSNLVEFLNSFLSYAETQGVDVTEKIPESSSPDDFKTALFQTIRDFASFYTSSKKEISETNNKEKTFEKILEKAKYLYENALTQMRDFVKDLVLISLEEFENEPDGNDIFKITMNDCYTIINKGGSKENLEKYKTETMKRECFSDNTIIPRIVLAFEGITVFE